MTAIPKKKPAAKRKAPPKKRGKAIKLAAPLLDSITFPGGYDLATEGTSQSLLQHFLQCRMKYKLALNLYKPVGAKNNTGFGSMTHDLLDLSYTYNVQKGHKPADLLISGWIDTFPKRCPDDVEGFSPQELEYVSGVNYVIMTEYMQYFKDDYTQMKFDEIEVVSESDWKGFKLRRKTDGKFRINGEKWLMEHKTKGYISEKNLLLQLAFDFQNLFYITCEEIDHPDDPVSGVLYNVIRRPAHMQKKNESLPDFLERLRSEIKRDPGHFFKRYEIKYTEQDKRDFKETLARILDEADKCIKGELPIFKNTTACVGAWSCEYLEACSSKKLSGYVQQKYWFPELGVGI